MNGNNTIYYLQHKDILDKDILINEIYLNEKTNYYFSDDFSPQFYIDLCKLGFISTSIIDNNEQYLLPEIQFAYALLKFEDLHTSKKVRKLIKKSNYIFEIDNNLEDILIKLDEYHKPNWLTGKYIELMINLNKLKSNNYKIKTFSIKDKESKDIIAAEVGYKIGNTYTSLTGFSSKEKKYQNYGTLQLVLTGEYLKNNNYKIWNLGHSEMEYKISLGAKVYKRMEFLDEWYRFV